MNTVKHRLDFTSKLVHVLAFGTPKFYIALYDKIKHELVNLSSNCDVKSGHVSKIVSIVFCFDHMLMVRTNYCALIYPLHTQHTKKIVSS